jgi:uncharacterized membrane protein YeaQ/YmgE (transglycosylase-associated protein family)
VPVVLTSAARGSGLDALERWLKSGTTFGLVGMSGAGKSTLTNALLGREAQRTGDVRGLGYREPCGAPGGAFERIRERESIIQRHGKRGVASPDLGLPRAPIVHILIAIPQWDGRDAMTPETIVIWLTIGLIAGMLTSKVVGHGFGVVADIGVGIVGAFLGGSIFRGMHLGTPFHGLASTIFVGVVGAVVLLPIARLFGRGSSRSTYDDRIASP